jgi:hypothetical protein
MREEQRLKLDANKRVFGEQPYAGTLLGPSCKRNLVRTIRYDDYGCYAEEAARRGIQTSCSVLTRSELEAALEAKLLDGIQNGTNCTYAFADRPLRHPFRMTIRWKDGSDEVGNARSAQAILIGRLQKKSERTNSWKRSGRRSGR